MESATPRSTLHEMVGLGPHATTEELRNAYERAMSRATRAGDHKLAVSLSRAYDELSQDRHARLYHVPDRVIGAPPAAVRASRRRRRYRRRSRAWKRGLALVAVIVVLAGALAGYIAVYHK